MEKKNFLKIKGKTKQVRQGDTNNQLDDTNVNTNIKLKLHRKLHVSPYGDIGLTIKMIDAFDILIVSYAIQQFQ